MSLDPELLEILVCPNDRGEIEYHEAEHAIVCLKLYEGEPQDSRFRPFGEGLLTR